MISREKKTPKSIVSKERNAILYFLTLLSIEKFHDNSMQIGVKKAVSKTSSKLSPSTPSVSFMFENDIHEISSQSWNWVFVGSKKQKRIIDRLNTSKDQKSEKFRTKPRFVEGTKHNTKAPMAGRIVSDNNISKSISQIMDLNHCFLITKQTLLPN